MSALDLIAQARALLGVPWKHQGRTGTGVDCIGLVTLAAQRCGLDLFVATGIADRRYSRRASPALLDLVCSRFVPVSSATPGAVLLFQFTGERYPRHFGILSERGTIIHAEAKARGQVVEHGYRAQWLRWTHSAWRLPGVIYE